MSERRLMYAIRDAMNAVHGVHMWRNNVGKARFAGRWVAFGMGKGSADLIGHIDGRFAAVEVKTMQGRTSEEQRRWLATRRDEGCFACVARSPAEGLDAVRRCRDGEDE